MRGKDGNSTSGIRVIYYTLTGRAPRPVRRLASHPYATTTGPDVIWPQHFTPTIRCTRRKEIAQEVTDLFEAQIPIEEPDSRRILDVGCRIAADLLHQRVQRAVGPSNGGTNPDHLLRSFALRPER